LEKKPTLESFSIGGTDIPSSDYSIEYSNNKNAGTATAKIIGKNSYAGLIKTIPFMIIKKRSVFYA